MAIRDPECGLVHYLFLSPYSPDYNPIERCFAQIKSFIRRNEDAAVHDLRAALQDAIKIVTPVNARAYSRSAGLNIAEVSGPQHSDLQARAAEVEDETAAILAGVCGWLKLKRSRRI